MSLPSSLSRAARFVGIALLPCIGRADVLVVAPSGAPYTDIGLAVNAANDGDVILVRAGAYGPFLVKQKSVTIVGEAGGDINVGPVLILDISASQHVTLAGLRSAAPGGGIECNNCVGPVRVVDSTFGGATFTQLNYPPPPVVFIYSCVDLAFNGCRIEGYEDAQHGGSEAIVVHDSTVAFSSTIIRGGRGRDGEPWYNHNGGTNGPGGYGLDAIECQSSALFFSGCRVTGGRGGPGLDGVCGDLVDCASAGGGGGGGLFVTQTPWSTDSTVRLLDSIVQGGMGGHGGSNSCDSASNGSPGGTYGGGQIGGPSPFLVMPGTARSMSPIACAIEGGSLFVSFRGQPGDRAYLGIANDSAYAYVPSLHGPLLLADHPLRSKFIGVLDATGYLEARFPVTDLGPGVQSMVREAQGIVIGADGNRWVTGSSPMVRLDSAF